MDTISGVPVETQPALETLLSPSCESSEFVNSFEFTDTSGDVISIQPSGETHVSGYGHVGQFSSFQPHSKRYIAGVGGGFVPDDQVAALQQWLSEALPQCLPARTQIGACQAAAHEEVHGPDGRALPLDGITIEALQQIADGPRFTEETTTEQACQHILKADGMPPDWTDLVSPVPGTPYSTHRFRNDSTGQVLEEPPPGTRSIAQVLRESDPAAVGVSNRFISHYWQMPFRGVVRAVARRVEQERAAGVTEEIYLWFDVISIDEHHAQDYAKGFSTTFMNAIKQIGHVYLIAEPWSGPKVLTRSWCLWELFCCYEVGAILSVCLDCNNEALFLEALRTEGIEAMHRIFTEVDSSTAQASNPKDTEKIGAEIAKRVGFTKLDGIVLEQLRAWLTQTAAQALEEMSPSERAVSIELVRNLGGLYKEQGKLEQAELLYVEVLDAQQAMLGDRHPDTLNSINNLGGLYKEQGKLEQAEPLFIEVLDAKRAILGYQHPDTLTSINNLGVLYKDQGMLDQAEPLFIEVLDAMRATLGHYHPKTLISINNLGRLYQEQGMLEQAEPLFVEALDAMRATRGGRHPNTLTSISNLGRLYQAQGKLGKAELLFVEALAAMRATLGDQHPNTMVAISNLGGLYKEQGKLEQAELLCVEALAARRATLGDRHPDTLTCIGNLVDLLREAGKLVDAEAVLGNAVVTAAKVLGEQHPISMVIAAKAARLRHAEDGAAAEGTAMMSVVVERMLRVLGAEHPQTYRYAAILRAMADDDDTGWMLV